MYIHIYIYVHIGLVRTPLLGGPDAPRFMAEETVGRSQRPAKKSRGGRTSAAVRELK